MSPRPHHYDPDAGGIRHAKRRAVADRAAIDAGGYPDVKGGCRLWLFVFAGGLVGAAGLIGGWLFGALS